VPRITAFCVCIYVFGCKLSLFGLCDSDLGITPVGDITIGITCTVFCFHIAHISFASSWYLLCFSVIIIIISGGSSSSNIGGGGGGGGSSSSIGSSVPGNVDMYHFSM
jgi:uncharacterized membrane protein YgcG